MRAGRRCAARGPQTRWRAAHTAASAWAARAARRMTCWRARSAAACSSRARRPRAATRPPCTAPCCPACARRARPPASPCQEASVFWLGGGAVGGRCSAPHALCAALLRTAARTRAPSRAMSPAPVRPCAAHRAPARMVRGGAAPAEIVQPGRLVRRACALAGGWRCRGAGEGLGRGGGGRGSGRGGGGMGGRGAQARGGGRRGAGRRGEGAAARGGARRCERGCHAAAPGAGAGAAPGAPSRRALGWASWGFQGRCGACLTATRGFASSSRGRTRRAQDKHQHSCDTRINGGGWAPV